MIAYYVERSAEIFIQFINQLVKYIPLIADGGLILLVRMQRRYYIFLIAKQRSRLRQDPPTDARPPSDSLVNASFKAIGKRSGIRLE